MLNKLNKLNNILNKGFLVGIVIGGVVGVVMVLLFVLKLGKEFCFDLNEQVVYVCLKIE